MRSIALISLLTILILTTSTKSEVATSGNLLPNAGTGTTSFQNQSGSIDGINGSTGWTTTGVTNFGNELEINGTGSVSANGSLLGINTTKESDGASFTTTADSLDGGVRLNSTTEVQNCEWVGSAYQCGNAQAGQDTYSTTVIISDENNQQLSKVTQTRNTDAGYYGNTFTYTDTVIYTGTGSRNWSWEWAGTNVANPNTTSADGPNLLGAELTASLLDIHYSALPTSVQTELTTFDDEISKEFKELEESVKIEEEFKFEEEFTTEEPKFIYEESFKFIKNEESKEESFETFAQEEDPVEEVVEEQKEEVSEPSSLQAEQSSNEEEDTSQETSSEEEQNTEVADDNNDNVSGEKKSISLADNIKAIDVKVKDPGENMELKNLVKLDAMIDNTMLLSYANLPFYKDKKIYTDQINIFDNRILYDTVTLVSYQQNDPIFQREKALFDIRQEKQKLIKELEILKNGKT